MVYDIGFVANSSGMMQFFQRVNTELTEGWFGVMILLMIFTMVLIATLVTTQSGAKAFATASFIGFGLGLLMRIVDLVPDLAIFMLLIMSAASIAMLKGQ